MSRQETAQPRARRRLSGRIRSFAIIVFLTLMTVGLPPGAPSALAAKMHAILIIDTADRSIGDMVALDLELVEKELAQIGKLTGMPTVKTILKGPYFLRSRVGPAISNLSVGSDDVIFFYYSGHGFRTKQKVYKWPYFALHDKPLDYAWVIQQLMTKKARLTITLTDACNNVINGRVSDPAQYRAKALPNPDAYRTLFLKHKGVIAATSSVPGEYSTATRSGSLFTLSFLKALNEEGAKANPSWVNLMKRGAGQKLYYNGEYKHTPYYEMNVAHVSPGGGAPAVNPPAPPSPTVQPPAPQQPQMACKVPAGAGAPSGNFGGFPYWSGKFFKGMHYDKAGATTAAMCHSACLKDRKCVSWIWIGQDRKCVFKHYCPKESYGPMNKTVSGYSGRKPLCRMGPGCGLKDAAAAAPAPAPAPAPAQQPDPFGGGIQTWGQPGGSAPAMPQAPAPAQQGGGWQTIN